jgi:hypothetical protein
MFDLRSGDAAGSAASLQIRESCGAIFIALGEAILD